ncbi:opsin-5-like [Alosa sapidissima]|uniref:opsin-5-like n=1 Tax=Alosa sapidissima TaxID=34773 RepID=UPI001C089400|nr:opsin-5-like [Alosa sapidissima]
MEMESYKSKLQSDVDYFSAGFLAVVATVSGLGNTLLLTTLLRRFSTLKAPELLYINLSLCDLVAVICMYPLCIVSALNHGWMGGEWTCTYYGLIGCMHAGAHIMTLTFLAVVRCIISFNAYRPRKFLTRKKVFNIVLLIWMHAGLWALMPLWGWGKYGPEVHGLSCSLAWGELCEAGGLSFIFSSFATTLIIPAVVIVTCYTCIAVRLHLQYKSMESRRRMSRRLRVVRRVVLIAVLMSAGFLTAWLPYATVSFWLIFNPTSTLHPVISLLPSLFAKSSAAYNPIIISIMCLRFRSDVKQLLADICSGGKADVALAERPNVSIRESSAPAATELPVTSC